MWSNVVSYCFFSEFTHKANLLVTVSVLKQLCNVLWQFLSLRK